MELSARPRRPRFGSRATDFGHQVLFLSGAGTFSLAAKASKSKVWHMQANPTEVELLCYLAKYCPGTGEYGAITFAPGVWSVVADAKSAGAQWTAEKLRMTSTELEAVADGLSKRGFVGIKRSQHDLKLWITDAGRFLVVPTDTSRGNGRRISAALWERIAAVVFGFVAAGLGCFLVIRNEPIADPTFQVIIRILMSTAVAIFTGTVPGFLKVKWSTRWFAVRAVGALAVFVLTYVYTPKIFTLQPPEWPKKAETIFGPEFDTARRVAPLGTPLVMTVAEIPADAAVQWSSPLCGTLDRSDARTVTYTGTKVGAEELTAVVTRERVCCNVRTQFYVRAPIFELRQEPTLPHADWGEEPRFPELVRPFPSVGAALRNGFPHALRVQAIEVELKDFAVDPRPDFAFEVLLFFDYLVIKPVDRGWGEPIVAQLRVLTPEKSKNEWAPAIFAPPQMPAPDHPPKPKADGAGKDKHDDEKGNAEAEKPFELQAGLNVAGRRPTRTAESELRQLAKILDLSPPAVELQRGAWGRYQFYKLGSKAGPLEMVLPPAVGPLRRTAYKEWTLGSLIEESVGGARLFPVKTESPIEGSAVRFQGALQAGEWADPVGYRARELQLQPFSEESLFLSHLLGGGLQGRMSDNWFVATEGVFTFHIEMAQMTRIWGLTVDCNDGRERRRSYLVDAEVQPGNALRFDINVTSAKSARITAAIGCTYQIGDGPSAASLVRDFTVRTRIPRAASTGWDETLRFLEELRRFEPQAPTRALEVLESARRPPLDGASAKQTVSARLVRDALLVLAVDPDPASSKAVAEFMQFLVTPAGSTFVDAAFPLLCESNPKRAVELALTSYESKKGPDRNNTKLIAIGLCVPEFVRELKSNRARILRALSEGPGERPLLKMPAHLGAGQDQRLPKIRAESDLSDFIAHDPIDVILAVLAGVPDLGKNLPRPDSWFAKDWALAAWATSLSRSPDLEMRLRERLGSDKVFAEDAVLMIDAWGYTANDRFWSDVHQFARRAANDPAFVEALAASLRYFQRFPPRAGLRPLLQDLESYPHDKSIRDAARAMLGRRG
jgi:hypothetical protein